MRPGELAKGRDQSAAIVGTARHDDMAGLDALNRDRGQVWAALRCRVSGFLGFFASLDNPTSSTLTRKELDWHPERPGLLDDLDEGHYFAEEQR